MAAFSRIEKIESNRIIIAGDANTWLCIYPDYENNNVTFNQELICVFTTKSFDDVLREVENVIYSNNPFDAGHLMI